MWKTKTTSQSTEDLSSKHQTSEIYLRTSYLMQLWTQANLVGRAVSICKEPNASQDHIV